VDTRKLVLGSREQKQQLSNDRYFLVLGKTTALSNSVHISQTFPAQDIETHSIFDRIDYLFCLVLHIQVLRRIQIAFKNTLKHTGAEVFHDFCQSLQPAIVGYVVTGYDVLYVFHVSGSEFRVSGYL
jgi:hypothetical protein